MFNRSPRISSQFPTFPPLTCYEEDWDLGLNKMSDGEQQEDELLALASIYDERIFNQSSEEKGGQFNVFLELPKPFKLKIQSRSLPKHFTRKEIEASKNTADAAQNTRNYEILEAEYLPPIVLNFRFPEDYPSSSPPLFTLSCKWLTVFQVLHNEGFFGFVSS